MSEKMSCQENGKKPVSRREFIKAASVVGTTAAFLGSLPYGEKILANDEYQDAYKLADPNNQIYSVCLQCNTGCGIKVKILDGSAAKIDGNPYSPWTMWPHVAYETPVKDMAGTEGAICPKGQAGLQSAYDPYRLTAVLKRKPGTSRGAGQWMAVPFDQAVDEIVNGGDLFGEGRVEGLRNLYAVKDPSLAADMDKSIKSIWAENDPEKKQALVGEFKQTFADHLDVLIDPDHPDLGPKNNQFAFIWGRLKNGRGDLVQRFVRQGFGSTNANGHTTVCQGSMYFAGKAMSEQWDGSKFSGGAKFYWQADAGNSEFVIYVGANVFEANYGPPQRVPKITEGLAEGTSRYAIVDPRLSKAAARAWKWVPIKPGEDAALAMGMIRWIIENERYNTAFITNANKAAANAGGEVSWTTGSWLVKLKDGKPGKFLRGSDLGLAAPGTQTDADGKEVKIFTAQDGRVFKFDPFVAFHAGEPILFDPNSSDDPAWGEPFVHTTLNGIECKTGLQVILEDAQKYTLEEWAEIAGINPQDIVDLAYEFTSHGPRACADLHRGASQHTNGFYNILAWFTLNALVGNYDHKGGMIKGTTYDRTGGRANGPFVISKMNNGSNMPFGIDLLRTNATYEKTTLFEGYPSKRPWFPLATDLYQEDVPSMEDAYPYPIKVAMFYMSAINYALPAGQTVSRILADPKNVPLVITSDTLIGEASTYADYIFPDISYLERWEFHGTHFSVTWKVENVRQPAIAISHWPSVNVFGEEMPLSFEALLLAVADRLSLPGFGPNGFGEGIPYTRPEHLYLKLAANLAFGEKEDGSDAVPEADNEELEIFYNARRHLPAAVYDHRVWRDAIGNDDSLWRRLVYVLNRGGRYQDYEKGYKGAMAGNPYAKQINLYQEKTATTINTMTGKTFIGFPTYIPPGLSSTGEAIPDPGYDLTLITYKEMLMTKARTITNYWLLSVLPENSIIMNVEDATRLGLKEGERVKLVCATNTEGVWDLQDGTQKPMVGALKTVQGLRPGVVSFSLGYGHWASGSRDQVIDGNLIPADPRRTAGVHGNAAMRIDPHLGNVTLSDIAGGSAVFYDTKVKVVRA